jgi:predicted permease
VLTLSDDATGEPIRVNGVEASENLFRVLGVSPVLGRGFSSDSTLAGSVPEVVISHRLWQTRFGGDRTVLGRVLKLNSQPWTIIGVMPPGFDATGETDVWQGCLWDYAQHSRGAHFLEVIGRIKPALSTRTVNADLAALGARLGDQFKTTNQGWVARVVPLDREVAGVFRPALFALLGAAALLLLIACINVANLLLARATARKREVALRATIGATRPRLVRLFLTESLVLAVVGSLFGLVVAVASVKGLLAWSPIVIPRAQDVRVDAVVLVFATLIAVVTTIAFGLAPALFLSRADLQEALKEGAKGVSSRARGTRRGLVVAQLALATVLLCGGGLLVRSVAHMLAESAGVDPHSVITADLQLSGTAYSDWGRVDQFYRSVATALRERPEVIAAGTTEFLPLAVGWRLPITVVGAAPVAKGDEPTAQFHSADEGYFTALRVPLLRGRFFNAHDDSASIPVMIVNEALAKQLWPGEDATGKRIITTTRFIGPLGARLTTANEHEVVGVVADVKNNSLRNAADPALYFSQHQFPFRKMHIVVRGRGEPAQLAGLIRDAVRRLDPSLPVADVKTMERVLSESVDPPRFVMLLLALFAILALTLAAVGVYGILTYTVNQRRREIGIRLALGASPAGMTRMVIREGLVLAVAGAAIGLAGTYAASRALTGFLYRVSPWDPITLGAVIGLVLVVSTAACLVPGRRASAEDPAGTLRAD